METCSWVCSGQEVATPGEHNDAYLYGSWDENLGRLAGGSKEDGKALRAKFEKAIPALGELTSAVKEKAGSTGYLRALDGQLLPVRSLHSALNTLLQSCGAIICKSWRVEIDAEAERLGLKKGADYFPLLAVHDEYEFECPPEVAPILIKACEQSIITVGKRFNFRCPLAAEAKQGQTWADVH